MKILAFLQNQWFKDPQRMQNLLAGKHYNGNREQFTRDFLFFGCLTGRRLQAAFGEDLCQQIIWEEASPQICGKASDCPPADPAHMAAAIAKHQPDIILAFGAVAGEGLRCVSKPLKVHIICGPHPAARGSNTLRDLHRMAERMTAMMANVRLQEATS